MAITLVFFLKLICCVFLTVGVYFLLQKKQLFVNWQKERDVKYLSIGFLLFRVIPWIIVFLIVGIEPRGDIPFFFGKAIHAKVGAVVYRDFLSYHAPIFPYLISLPLFLWHNMKAIVLFMILAETAILFFTYYLYKPKKDNALQLVFLYWLLPATFSYMLIGGQEDNWFSGVAIIMLYYIRKNPIGYEVGLGVIFAVAMLVTKATFIIYFIPLLLLVQKPYRFAGTVAFIGFTTICFLYYWIGDLFLMPIQHTSQIMSPNLFSISRPFVELFYHIDDENSTLLNWGGLFFSIAVPSYIAWKVRKNAIEQTLIPIFVATFASLIVFQPSSPGAYMIAFVLLLVFEVIDVEHRREVLLLLLLNWMTVIQPFLYVYLGQVQYTSFTYLSNPLQLLEAMTQVVNVGCLGWVIWLSYQKARAIPNSKAVLYPL